jgi:hypothetical protein
MYKKITHSIVEEHFDHPMAAKIKAGLRPTITRKARFGLDEEDIIFGRPTTEIFDKEEFTKKVESYVNDYTQKLVQITDTTAGTEEQLVDAFEKLFDFVDDITHVFNPFYNRELGEKVATSLRHIASSVTMISHATKAGWDSTQWVKSMNNAVGVADFTNYNNLWTRFAIENIMREFMTDIVKRINAVKLQDQPEIDRTTNQVWTAMQLFKNVIVNGITQQFPQRFTS